MRTALSARPAPMRFPAAWLGDRNVGLMLYVSGVVAAGGLLLVKLWPQTYPDPRLVILLLAGAITLSLFKLRLPLNQGASNMTLAYAVDFVALLVFDANLAMAIAAAAVVVQSTA